MISSICLTAILLFANFSKHSDLIFRALSVSPLIFGELLLLIFPLALSFGLPFGFALSVIFCLGKWKADQEIIALESLGFSGLTWISPIFVLALLMSILSSIAALHWSPIARAGFESRVKELIWDDTSMLSGQQLMVPFKKNQTMNRLFEGENSILNRDISSISVSIGEASVNEWSNVRIVGWEGDHPLGVLHAKKSKVIKDRQTNQISLFLEKVDFESLGNELDNPVKESQFVSFDKWKEPLILELNLKTELLGNKTTSILDVIKIWLDGSNIDLEFQGLSKHFSKYASVSLAPICLSPFLIFTALRRGRKETYANVFIGVVICMLYFLICMVIGEFTNQYGHGYIISSMVIFVSGLFFLRRFIAV